MGYREAPQKSRLDEIPFLLIPNSPLLHTLDYPKTPFRYPHLNSELKFDLKIASNRGNLSGLSSRCFSGSCRLQNVQDSSPSMCAKMDTTNRTAITYITPTRPHGGIERLTFPCTRYMLSLERPECDYTCTGSCAHIHVYGTQGH